MAGSEQFERRRENLELIKAFTNYSLYYDHKDESLWFWDGVELVGKDVEDIYSEITEV